MKTKNATRPENTYQTFSARASLADALVRLIHTARPRAVMWKWLASLVGSYVGSCAAKIIVDVRQLHAGINHGSSSPGPQVLRLPLRQRWIREGHVVEHAQVHL